MFKEQPGKPNPIDDIIAKAQRGESEDLVELELCYGSKSLRIIFEKVYLRFSSHLDNLADKNNRIEGETTLLYRAAYKMMKNIAQEKQEPLKYVLETKNKKMKKWARTSGDEIFKWDRVEGSWDDNKYLYCHSTISSDK